MRSANSSTKAAESRNWCAKWLGSKLIPNPGRLSTASSALRAVTKSYAISVGWTSSAKRTPSSSKKSEIGVPRAGKAPLPPPDRLEIVGRERVEQVPDGRAREAGNGVHA